MTKYLKMLAALDESCDAFPNARVVFASSGKPSRFIREGAKMLKEKHPGIVVQFISTSKPGKTPPPARFVFDLDLP